MPISTREGTSGRRLIGRPADRGIERHPLQPGRAALRHHLRPGRPHRRRGPDVRRRTGTWVGGPPGTQDGTRGATDPPGGRQGSGQ